MTKHFLKTLVIFIVIIVLGLIGIVLTSNSGNKAEPINTTNNQTQVAK